VIENHGFGTNLSRSAGSTTVNGVEQARGIFYTTQDTLLLTCRGEESLLVVEGREKRMIIIA